MNALLGIGRDVSFYDIDYIDDVNFWWFIYSIYFQVWKAIGLKLAVAGVKIYKNRLTCCKRPNAVLESKRLTEKISCIF